MQINNKYLELLNCNLEKITNFDLNTIKEEMEIYKIAINDWSNYGFVPKLENWKHPRFVYPNLHPIHKKIVDTVSRLSINTICEVGSGAGSVAKYVYNSNNNFKLTCIEGCDDHIAQMKQNFNRDNLIIIPQIEVKANIIKGIAQEIPLENESQDLVYTCTVLMHIPFLMAVKAIEDIARVSKKYVLHLERKDGNIIIGKQKSQLNNLKIDYQSIYEKLGFKTIKYEEFPYPEHEHLSCIYYLGEK